MSEEQVYAQVVGILGRTGMHGEVTQVHCKILTGPSKDTVIVRNIYGPVKIGDIVLLLEADKEAKKLETR